MATAQVGWTTAAFVRAARCGVGMLFAALAMACTKAEDKGGALGSSPIALNEAAYQAEIAALREQVQRGSARESPWAITNAHEHLMEPAHFSRYLAAARRQGIVRTVVVTSPHFTLYGKGDKGYRSMAANWEQLVRAHAQFGGAVVPFASIDPRDPDKLEHLQHMVADGARGAKLYSGHSNLYDLPLDDASMDPIYAYLEEQRLPVNWHINLSKYGAELERVLDAHPKLNVMVPHYGVAFWSPDKAMPALRALLDQHPNVYIDTSLGTRDILVDGMFVIGEQLPLFRKFFTDFQDRIVYGSDSVITGNPEKTTNWYFLVLGGTRDQLERESFVFPLAEGYAKYFRPGERGHNPDGRVAGLALPAPILQKIYDTNARAWLEKYKPLEPMGSASPAAPTPPPP